MINQSVINEVRDRLVKTYNPIEIYLFGSYAWGTPTKDSDLDILIVVDFSSERSFDRVRPGHKALTPVDVSKDLIVYTKEEFERYINDRSTLGYKIKKEGKQIYARA